MSDEGAKTDFSREPEPTHELTIHEVVMGYPEIFNG